MLRDYPNKRISKMASHNRMISDHIHVDRIIDWKDETFPTLIDKLVQSLKVELPHNKTSIQQEKVADFLRNIGFASYILKDLINTGISFEDLQLGITKTLDAEKSHPVIKKQLYDRVAELGGDYEKAEILINSLGAIPGYQFSTTQIQELYRGSKVANGALKTTFNKKIKEHKIPLSILRTEIYKNTLQQIIDEE